MQRKINLTQVICFWMGKTYTEKMTKTPPCDFKVTTPENSLLSQQAVTSKGIPVPYTNLQLNPHPNIQLDLCSSDNLSFQCMSSSTWLTNWCMDPNTWLITYLKRILAAKFFSSLTRLRSRNSLVTKPYGVQIQ